MDTITNRSRAASTIAANTILRSAVGCAFPLFSRQMMQDLGVQWAGTMLGCIAAVMIPIPVVFKLYGPWLRSKSKLACSPVYDVEKKPYDA
jgi:DHA1 family multidrug resistance protein-like MFS transporter